MTESQRADGTGDAAELSRLITQHGWTNAGTGAVCSDCRGKAFTRDRGDTATAETPERKATRKREPPPVRGGSRAAATKKK
jgi:hypothetical protein